VGYQPGDEAARGVALGLAEKLDAPTLLALDKLVTLLETVGGQVYVMAVRSEDELGSEDFKTVGLDFHYQTRDARLKIEAQPEEALGVPVTDMEAPPVSIAPEQDGSGDYQSEPEVASVEEGATEESAIEADLEETATAG
jgi:hypothetical protein